MSLTVRPLTLQWWPALEGLFGRAGASNGCWCMYWRIGPRYRDRPRADNRDDLRQLAASDQPPGLLAFDGDLAVGWCELAPRAELAWLGHSRYLAPVDDLPVWSLPCFYVRRTHRGRRRRSGPGGLSGRHGRAGPHHQPVPGGRGGLRPARLRCRGAA